MELLAVPHFNVFGNLGRHLITEVKPNCSSFDDLQNCNGLPVPLLGQESLPISITELFRQLCHRELITHLENIKTEAMRLRLFT